MSAVAAPIDLIPALPAARTLTAADLDGLVEELAAYHAHFAPLFRRPEQRAWAAVYLRGLLTADVPRKNVEALALRLLGAGAGADRRVRALQQFVGAGGWDDAGLLAAHRRLVDATLGADDGVLIVDGHETPKQGTHSVGVARHRPGGTRRAQRQARQLPGGRVSRLCQPPGLHAAGPAAVPARRLVRRGVRRPPLGLPHPARHPVPHQARAGRGLGRGGGGGRDAAGALGGLRRGLRRQPGAAGPLGGDGAVVPGRGGARHAGVAPGRTGRADAARPADRLGAAPRRLGQGAGPHEGAPPPRQPRPAAGGRVGGAGPRRAVAALPPPRREQGAAGRRVRRGAGRAGARPPTRPGRLAAGAPGGAGHWRGGRGQVLPLECPGRDAAGRIGATERHALADRGLFRRGAPGVGPGPLRDPHLAGVAPPHDPRHPRAPLPGPAATAARPERGGPANRRRPRSRRARRARRSGRGSCRPCRSG